MIFVTGGAGFIGSNFVLDWMAAGKEPIVNLDKLTYAGNRHTLEPLDRDRRHTFVQGDITDKSLLEELLLQHRPRAVIHFAAESHVDRSIHDPTNFIETNIIGHLSTSGSRSLFYWQNLPPGSKESFRFVHVSTDEVYGTLAQGDPAFAETHPLRAQQPLYSASKAASDHLVRAWHGTYGLPAVTTNCSNN